MTALASRLRVARALWRGATPVDRATLVRYAILTALTEVFGPRSPFARDLWVQLGGSRFRVAPGRGELSAFAAIWSDREYEAVADFRARPGWLVVDVGANVGFFAVLQATRGATVVAIEPNPEARGRLERTLHANGMVGRVTVLPYAIGPKAGAGTLLVGTSTQTGALSGPFDGRPVRSFQVAVATLDEGLVRHPGRIDLLKLDVEGDVADALAGGPATLARTERVVLEYHTEALLERIVPVMGAQRFTLRHRQGWIASFERGPGRADG